MGKTFKDCAGYHCRQTVKRAHKAGAMIVGSAGFHDAYREFFRKRGMVKHGMADDINPDCGAGARG